MPKLTIEGLGVIGNLLNIFGYLGILSFQFEVI